jgi:hypothetical protein
MTEANASVIFFTVIVTDKGSYLFAFDSGQPIIL